MSRMHRTRASHRATAPPRHASSHALVPRTPLRRTCQSRVIYMYIHIYMSVCVCVCACLQDLLVPLRLWMDVDLGIAVGAACSRRRLGSWGRRSSLAWLPVGHLYWHLYWGWLLRLLAAPRTRPPRTQ